MEHQPWGLSPQMSRRMERSMAKRMKFMPMAMPERCKMKGLVVIDLATVSNAQHPDVATGGGNRGCMARWREGNALGEH